MKTNTRVVDILKENKNILTEIKDKAHPENMKKDDEKEELKKLYRKLYSNEEKAFFILVYATSYLMRTIEVLFSDSIEDIEKIRNIKIGQLIDVNTENTDFFRYNVLDFYYQVFDFEKLLYKDKNIEDVFNVLYPKIKKDDKERAKKQAIIQKLKNDYNKNINKNRKEIFKDFKLLSDIVELKKDVCNEFIDYCSDNLVKNTHLFDNDYVKNEAKIKIKQSEIDQLDKEIQNALDKHEEMEALKKLESKVEIECEAILENISYLIKSSKDIRKMNRDFINSEDTNILLKIFNIYTDNNNGVIHIMDDIIKLLNDLITYIYQSERVVGISIKDSSDPRTWNKKWNDNIPKHYFDEPTQAKVFHM